MKTNNNVKTNKKNWVERRVSGELAWWMKVKGSREKHFWRVKLEERICLSAYLSRSFNSICFDSTCVPTNRFLTMVHVCLVATYFSSSNDSHL